MSKDTSRTASTLPNRRERLRTEMIGSPAPGGGGGGTAGVGGGAGSGGGFIGKAVRSARDGDGSGENRLLLVPTDRGQRFEERPVLRHGREISRERSVQENAQVGVQDLAAADRRNELPGPVRRRAG